MILPQGKHEIVTDSGFLNKLLFAITYLGPSVSDIKNYLDEGIAKDKRPKLQPGYMKAYYLDENSKKVYIRWRWDVGMKVNVKAYKNKEPVAISFDSEDETLAEHDAMPFEIALLNSILNEEEPGDS